MSADTPQISTAFDMDEGQHVIMASSYGQTMPAGPRLFRSPPYPDIRFSHDNQADAERDARKLREYLEGVASKRGPSKAKLRKSGAD